MPRKKTVQPEPLETFEVDNVTVEIRDYATREIGRGLDRKFVAEDLIFQVLIGLVDDEQSGDPKRIERAATALASTHAMARHLLDGGYEMDERTARRHGKKIISEYHRSKLIQANVKSGAD